MAWVATLKVTDCASSNKLVGAYITDGSVTYYTDVNGQFIAIVNDAFHTYIVTIGKAGYVNKTFAINKGAHEGKITTICLDPVPEVPPSCCFTGDTRVTLADGTEKPIDLVRAGDLVLGRSGEPNRVIGIERPPLGGRRLYAINQGAPFVTAEHPFMTEAGWKAVDPDATAAENAHLVVGCLTVGDAVLRLQGIAVPAGDSAEGLGDPVLEPISLARLEQREADPETTLYNLLLDGDHAYFANGFLVHNKGGGW